MKPERWQQIRGVLEEALELPPDQRSAFLQRNCSADPSLRQEVESLLASGPDERSSLLQSSPLRVTLTSGTKLGEYEVKSLLGSGGMGEVYRARDPRLGRDVAIKVLPLFAANSDQLRRFELEARAAAALNHPNILAVFQMGTYEAAPYLVSELLEGETLRGQLKRGPLSVRKTIDYGVQIARGLAAAHEKGIVHRDLKPENLFVTRDGMVKILDFGLAKLTRPQPGSDPDSTIFESQTVPGAILGTIGYMSPEQVRGQPADARSDIFALGAILYEMLCGQPAFRRETAADTQSAILKEDPNDLLILQRNAPAAVERVVCRCLEKAPDHRFQSALDLGFALEAVSVSTDTPIHLPGTPENQLSTRPWWWGAVAVVIAAAVIAVSLHLWPRSAPPGVEGVYQITDDGNPKATSLAAGATTLVSDGTRVYFNEIQGGTLVIVQVAAIGGQTSQVSTGIKRPMLAALAPDSSSLLVLDGDLPYNPLWRLPLPAGEPRRLSDLVGHDAAFSPDGHVVLAKDLDLYVAEKDGSNSRKLAAFPNHISNPVVSPDGKRIRLTVSRDFNTRSLWEVNSDGSDPHILLQSWQSAADACCGRWTPDGRYFVFQSRRGGRADLWALQEGSRWFGHSRLPLRLTNGPLSYEFPFPSPDGRQLFALGLKQRGELVRYEKNSHQFVPYLSGISAKDATVSRDGKWVTYVTSPDHALWRSRVDGKERLQLTYPPMLVKYPRISPDGTKVAFGSLDQNGNAGAYVLSLEGGTPRKIAANARNPSWSPDSNSVVVLVSDNTGAEAGFQGLRTVDLQTGKINFVPNSIGKGGTFWPQPGRLVAPAIEGGVPKFLSFDFRTQKWSDLLTGFFDNWMQSVDGEYLYYTTGRDDPKVSRIRLSDKHVETVASLKDFRPMVDEDEGTWVGVAPDGSVLLTRDIGTQEIYALSLDWP